MNRFLKGILINVGAIYALALLFSLSGDWSPFYILPVVVSFIEFFVALILLAPRQSRFVGQVMLAGSCIVFLIGLSLCSAGPNVINFH